METVTRNKVNSAIAVLMDGGDLSEGCLGYCLACGEEQSGCEPDARNYECESCGEHKVFGAEECLLMGFGV